MAAAKKHAPAKSAAKHAAPAAHAEPAHKPKAAVKHAEPVHKDAKHAAHKDAKHAAHKPAAKAAKASRPAAKGKAHKRPETAENILKHARPTKVEAHNDAPAPVKAKGKPVLTAKELLKHLKPTEGEFRHDEAAKPLVHAKQLLKQLGKGQFQFNRAYSTATFEEKAFMDFFGPEIDAELERVATIFNDRFARWPCQCCDVVIRVPRRTEVFHGDFHLVHDDVLGLLVNGERWIPKAETPLEIVQPGRIRNPWTGELVKPTRRSV